MYLLGYPGDLDNISTSIKFSGLDSGDYEDVSISIQMKGENFEFDSTITYYDEVLFVLV